MISFYPIKDKISGNVRGGRSKKHLHKKFINDSKELFINHFFTGLEKGYYRKKTSNKIKRGHSADN